MAAYFKTDNLAVGYGGNILIRDICLSVEKGKILTLIGPNGAGKSTILKSIIKNIAPIEGCVRIDGQEISQWSVKRNGSQSGGSTYGTYSAGADDLR